MKKTLLSIASSAVLAFGALSAGPAVASFASCVGVTSAGAYDITGKVTPSFDCTILLPLDGAENDNPLPGFVNTEEFFGYDDWAFDGKWDSPPPTGGTWSDTSTLFNFTGGGQFGTFALAGALGDISEIMLVFKDGGSTNLVGYMLDLTKDIGGVYNSPFTEPPFDYPGTGPRDVSHISVYYREDDGTTIIDVPEPASIALVGLALLGLAGASKRRRSS